PRLYYIFCSADYSMQFIGGYFARVAQSAPARADSGQGINTMQDLALNQLEEGSSLGRDAFLRLRKNKAAMTGAVILILMITVALLTPWIAPYSYQGQNLLLGASPPSAAHWLGTDVLG